jgi:hypothetical protein
MVCEYERMVGRIRQRALWTMGLDAPFAVKESLRIVRGSRPV